MSIYIRLGQNFFYSGIQALEKRWTKCIFVAKEYVEKWQNIIQIIIIMNKKISVAFSPK